MQAVIWPRALENYQLEEVIPSPSRVSPGEALDPGRGHGICASDLKCYHGAAKFWGDANRPAWAETEVIPGHEFVGKVVQLDDLAADRWGIAVGDRVVAEQIVPCWKCRYCVNGEYWMCAPHDMFGFKRRTPGGMAEYMVYNKDALVYKISPTCLRLTPHSPSRSRVHCTRSSGRDRRSTMWLSSPAADPSVWA
jgi:threonine dehydrogenase-like Zn-dependent dehydrogenase